MSYLEIIVFLPLIAAIAIGLGAPARFTALGAAAIAFIVSLIVAIQFNTNVEGAVQFASSHTLMEMEGFPTLSLAFGIDGISLVLLLLATLVMLAAVLVSPPENDIKGSAKLYYLSLLLIGGGAIGAFTATDLFFLYAFHELALIPTFLMIGIFGHGENRVRTAWTITVYLGVGSLILLVGLIMAVFALGGSTFAIADLIAIAKNPETGIDPGQQTWIFAFLLVGFGALVSLFPFHSWAAPAYAEAPAPVAMLHAGVLKKFGLYGLIRIAMPIVPEGMAALLNVVLVLLLGNIIYIGLVTIAQKKLDRMLGSSSVMHMGYVFLGLATMNQLGVSGAVLLMFAHGVSIALLFALCGWIREKYGTVSFEELGGIASHLPKLGLLFAFAAFASAGLPGFANFAAEVSVFFGAFKETGDSLGWLQWTTIIALWGVVISAVYMLRAFRNLFLGTPEEKMKTPTDMTMAARLPYFLLLATLIAVGFVPEILNQFIRPAVEGLFLTTAG
ncbi:MAG: NADH-quinone oxidoreductase subunit M [Verrucomicrobiales bacterium]|nr:NADH-quinone oxidoreductase subunit M [Verrucomicrobiales bacterium]